MSIHHPALKGELHARDLRTEERPWLAILISGGAILALFGAAIVTSWFSYERALLPIEIDPNEAWNAWQSKALDHLYPPPDALIINNYPPLYFYVLHGFERHGFEPIYAGRLLSMAAASLLTLLVYGTARELGARRMGAVLGALWFLATLSGAFTGYLGMNDPNLFALSVMCAGFLWFIRLLHKGRPAEPAILLMVLSGFIKHNIAAIPLTALIWLAFDSPRRALRGAVLGAAACAAGLAVCYAAFGRSFIDQLLLHRATGLYNLHYSVESLEPLIAATFIVFLWLLADQSRLGAKMAVLLLLTGGSGFIQRLGDGVDHNAYFEFLFALAVGVGLAMGSTAGFLNGALFRLAGAITLLVNLAITSKPEPYKYFRSSEFRAEIKENAEAVGEETERVRKLAGDVSCSVMLVCYWAGKPFVYDDFAMKQRVATGRWTRTELDRQAKLHGIRFETIDDRTVW
jgi:hypothetical protein